MKFSKKLAWSTAVYFVACGRKRIQMITEVENKG